MNRRTLATTGLFLAFLTACSGPGSTTYRLTFDTQDPLTIDELTKATVRVMERRLDRMQVELLDKNIVKDAEGVTVELRVEDGNAVEPLTDELTQPFTAQMMLATDDPQPAVMVEGLGGFNETDVSGDDVINVLAFADDDGQGATVQIRLTDDGHAALQEIFREHVGETLGLFVRGKLVSALTIVDPTVPNPFVIDGVPNIDIAQIFADDMNVGLNVTITPQ